MRVQERSGWCTDCGGQRMIRRIGQDPWRCTQCGNPTTPFTEPGGSAGYMWLSIVILAGIILVLAANIH